MSDAVLYGQGLLPHTIRWQGSTYLSQSYGAPLTFTQNFSSATNWWTPALEGQTQPLAQYSQTLLIGDVQGLWIFRVFLDGNLVGTFTFADQQFTIPVRFDRVEAVALGGMPFGSSSAFVTATGWNSTPPVADDPPPTVPGPGVALTCAVAAFLAAWGRGRKRRG